jgi:phosphoribosylaminoimidazole-succinocarboxamide synthase
LKDLSCFVLADRGQSFYTVHEHELARCFGTESEETMETFKPVKEGKVREIYDIGDALIMVATDRISAFDVILKNKVVSKGKVLTQMSRFWFDYTKDIIPNHMLSTDTKDMPEFFRTPEFEGRSMLCQKLTMIPIECIVRGYITGSGWESYKKNGTVCGIKLPAGLKECDKLPEPIYTPSTKAEIGDHDENISFEQSIPVLEKKFPGHGQEYAEKIKDATIALYKKCADYALSRGIIIADTKFEFGLDANGNVILGDEMLTPDSSRFWPLEGYEAGHGQPSFDKQFVRDWLKKNPDSDYNLPQDVIDRTIAKYKEAYKLLTGSDLKD